MTLVAVAPIPAAHDQRVTGKAHSLDLALPEFRPQLYRVLARQISNMMAVNLNADRIPIMRVVWLGNQLGQALMLDPVFIPAATYQLQLSLPP